MHAAHNVVRAGAIFSVGGVCKVCGSWIEATEPYKDAIGLAEMRCAGIKVQRTFSNSAAKDWVYAV